MARHPKPWFWKARNAWYVQLDGKQIKLHADKREAERIFYRLMASRGELEDKDASGITVLDAAEAWMEAHAYRRKATVRMHSYKVGPFAAAFQNRRLDSIKAAEIIKFTSEYRGKSGKPYGETSKCLMFRNIKTMLQWCRDTGLLAVNPLARIPSPWQVQKRNRPMSQEEYQKIMQQPRLNARFKEVVEFVWRTGIRPGELAALSASHMDAQRPIARFQPSEHKTGTKTGLQREVYFPKDLWCRLQDYARKRPQGPLLRNTRGKPWHQELISDTFHRVKERLGLDCVLYQARHSFLTRLMESGVPVARAAKIAGHTDTKILTSTYYHPDTEKMLDDVNRVSELDKEKKEKKEDET